MLFQSYLFSYVIVVIPVVIVLLYSTVDFFFFLQCLILQFCGSINEGFLKTGIVLMRKKYVEHLDS